MLQAVLASKLQPLGLRMVALVMAWHANETRGHIWASLGIIADEAGVSRDRVKQVVRLLVDQAAVEVVAAQLTGVAPLMVVVDRLSQTYAGEENSAIEMAACLRELGLKPHERFARQWIKGYLPLPLRVCSTEQLYRAFTRWARNAGERFPPAQVTFSKGVEKVLREKVRCKGVKLDMPVSGRAWLRMWIPAECRAPEGSTEGAWARSAVESFEADLRDFGAGELSQQ